jgi:hypothetical protein
MSAKQPNRRTKGLVVHTLADETLVYDLDRDRALVLNGTAALVYSLCDGKNTQERMAQTIQKKLAVADGAPLVEMALDELSRAHLLDCPPAKGKKHAAIPRREMLKRLKIAAAMLPSVFALLAPTAASASSFIANAACGRLLAGPTSRCPNQKCLPAGFPQRYCRTKTPASSGPQRRTCSCR